MGEQPETAETVERDPSAPAQAAPESATPASDRRLVHLPSLISDEFGISRSQAREMLALGTVEIDGEPYNGDRIDVPYEAIVGTLVSKIISTGQLEDAISKGVRPDLFADDECREMFEYVTDHARRYKSLRLLLPSAGQAGVRLADRAGPARLPRGQVHGAGEAPSRERDGDRAWRSSRRPQAGPRHRHCTSWKRAESSRRWCLLLRATLRRRHGEAHRGLREARRRATSSASRSGSPRSMPGLAASNRTSSSPSRASLASARARC
jgi:hypothetical protein